MHRHRHHVRALRPEGGQRPVAGLGVVREEPREELDFGEEELPLPEVQPLRHLSTGSPGEGGGWLSLRWCGPVAYRHTSQ